MSLRRTIVELDLDGLNVREFCGAHGVSTWFFYDLRRRYAAEGLAALEPRSRAPRRVANRTRAEVEDVIVGLRKELEGLGLDAGPATIAYHLPAALGAPEGRTPSEATIWRVLVRRGFVVAQPHKAPRHAHRSFTAARANECWQIDDTEWALADGSAVKIINVEDDATRVVVASRAVATCTGAAAFDAFVVGAGQWGWPERMLSDNAKAYRLMLAEALAPLGIAAGHSRPYHPQTCGKVERFHQTLKRYLDMQSQAATIEELQAQLDAFAALYNRRRPHRGIGRRIPGEVWAAMPKSGPADRPLGASTKVVRRRVQRNGVVGLGREGFAIGLGRRFAGSTATVVRTAKTCHVFIEGRLIRQLTLDPSRRSQPRSSRRT